MIVLVAMLIVLFIFVIALIWYSLYLCCSYRVCSTVCHMFVDQYECCHMLVVCHMLENAVKR